MIFKINFKFLFKDFRNHYVNIMIKWAQEHRKDMSQFPLSWRVTWLLTPRVLSVQLVHLFSLSFNWNSKLNLSQEKLYWIKNCIIEKFLTSFSEQICQCNRSYDLTFSIALNFKLIANHKISVLCAMKKLAVLILI